VDEHGFFVFLGQPKKLLENALLAVFGGQSINSLVIVQTDLTDGNGF